MVILLRSEPKRNINLPVQDSDPGPVIIPCVTRHTFLEAGRKFSFRFDLSVFCYSRFSFACSR